MRYQGGKTRQWKHIVPILEKALKQRPDSLYVEPFIGGGNIFTRVNHHHKMGNDLDADIVNMWQHFKDNPTVIEPSSITKDFYHQLRDEYKTNNRKHPSWMYAFVGHACSYGGKKWGGYAAFNPNKQEDHIKEACASTVKQICEKTFTDADIQFHCKDYRLLDIPDGSVIYCDPPYADTLGYGSDFDTNAFWEWCRGYAKRGCKVFVSEYNAPSDFKCVWKRRKKDGMGTTKQGKKQKTKIEKLFCYNGNS